MLEEFLKNVEKFLKNLNFFSKIYSLMPATSGWKFSKEICGNFKIIFPKFCENFE